MRKKLTLIALMMINLICITAGGVQANFQSSPNVKAKTNSLTNWMLQVRQMEASGQVMGLKETLHSTTLDSAQNLEGTLSNKIDVHLQKNTEYGAMLILAVSDYGKQGNCTTGSDYINRSTYGLATTTGNISGVYGIGSCSEWVSAGIPSYFNTKLNAIGSTNSAFYQDKYGNAYSAEEIGKIGDAMFETKGWQNGQAREVSKTFPALTRGGYGTSTTDGRPFTYFAYYVESGNYSARACIVNGNGF